MTRIRDGSPKFSLGKNHHQFVVEVYIETWRMRIARNRTRIQTPTYVRVYVCVCTPQPQPAAKGMKHLAKLTITNLVIGRETVPHRAAGSDSA